MSSVHFAFQEGFAGDTAVVRIDGREVVRKTGLQSQPTLALADAVTISVEQDQGAVKIEVPNRNISETFDVNFREHPYLGISIVGGRLTMKRAAQPFEYM
jgi:hypothetical protein